MQRRQITLHRNKDMGTGGGGGGQGTPVPPEFGCGRHVDNNNSAPPSMCAKVCEAYPKTRARIHIRTRTYTYTLLCMNEITAALGATQISNRTFSTPGNSVDGKQCGRDTHTNKNRSRVTVDLPFVMTRAAVAADEDLTSRVSRCCDRMLVTCYGISVTSFSWTINDSLHLLKHDIAVW